MQHVVAYVSNAPPGDNAYLGVVLVIALLCMWFGRKKK